MPLTRIPSTLTLYCIVLEGRGLKNGDAAHVYCAVKMKMNKSFKTSTAKGPDPKWNQSVTMCVFAYI